MHYCCYCYIIFYLYIFIILDLKFPLYVMVFMYFIHLRALLPPHERIAITQHPCSKKKARIENLGKYTLPIHSAHVRKREHDLVSPWLLWDGILRREKRHWSTPGAWLGWSWQSGESPCAWAELRPGPIPADHQGHMNAKYISLLKCKHTSPYTYCLVDCNMITKYVGLKGYI